MSAGVFVFFDRCRCHAPDTLSKMWIYAGYFPLYLHPIEVPGWLLCKVVFFPFHHIYIRHRHGQCMHLINIGSNILHEHQNHVENQHPCAFRDHISSVSRGAMRIHFMFVVSSAENVTFILRSILWSSVEKQTKQKKTTDTWC